MWRYFILNANLLLTKRLCCIAHKLCLAMSTNCQNYKLYLSQVIYANICFKVDTKLKSFFCMKCLVNICDQNKQILTLLCCK